MTKNIRTIVSLMRQRRYAILCEDHWKLRQYEEERLTRLIKLHLDLVESKLIEMNMQLTLNWD